MTARPGSFKPMTPRMRQIPPRRSAVLSVVDVGASKVVCLIARLLPDHLRLSRAEPGCLTFAVTPTADPLIWQVDETFADRAAFEAHQARSRASEWGRASAHIPRHYTVTGA